MLSLYGNFKVPGVEHVTIYRDDEDNRKFYMLTDLPSVARDDEGDPLFTFIMYARDLDRLDPEETEIANGYLSLTTHVAVSNEDEEIIRTYLKEMLSKERRRGFGFLRLALAGSDEPKLGYPTVFTDGSVEFVTFNDEMVPFTGGSSKPSLIGTNVASFSQILNQDGAELFRGSIEKGLIPAIIKYDLKFLARIPALTIHIHGDRSEFFKEVRQYVTRTYSTSYGWGWWGWHHYRHRTTTWQEFAGMKKFRETFHSLTIDIDDTDFRTGEEGEDLSEKLEELAFRILENNILPSFFQQAINDVAKEQTENDEIPMPSEETVKGTIDVWIRRSDVVEISVHPNAQLSQVLEAEEIKNHTVYLDLGQPFFEELDVKVHANVNFEDDPVYALKVFLDYDQQDEKRNVRVKKANEFLFKSSDQIQRFRKIMAKDANGAPKDSYNYWSEIVYKDSGETIRVPSAGSLESRERELVISYRRLGFVKVKVSLGPMPDLVESVTIDFSYPHSTSPSAEKTLELTKDSPTGSYFTYIGHEGEPKPYIYQVTYNLADGQKMDLPEQKSSSEVLVVSDPFEQTLKYRFLAQADFSVVEKILLDARYVDDENDYTIEYSAEFIENGEVSSWSIKLRNPLKRDIEYDVKIIYKDGSRDDQETRTHAGGGTVSVGVGAVDTLSVMVDAGLVDWEKYARVLVYLEYKDEENDIEETESMMIRKEDSGEIRTWKVLLRDSELKNYRYRIRYIGTESTGDREDDWQQTSDTILILR